MTRNNKHYLEPEKTYHLGNGFEIPALLDFDSEELCTTFPSARVSSCGTVQGSSRLEPCLTDQQHLSKMFCYEYTSS